MSEKKKAAIGRRDFFKKAGLGAGAVGGKGGRGYQETAHVKKYYELARF